ncbi:MAG: DPP IV N-terminal domain-containing protein [Bacteroidales bacterium]|nr:DPP IV N-terminal domain-containing protein [Bacteroidales bacterium]
MKKLITLLTFACIALTLFAQKPNYALAERFDEKKVKAMVSSLEVTPHWFKNSDKFWYEWKDSKGTNYYIVDPVAKSKTPVFNLERLAMQITEIMKDPFDAQHLPITSLKLKDDETFTFSVKGSQKTFRFEYKIATASLKDVTEEKEDPAYPSWANIAPDKSIAIFSKEHNLWYMSMEDVEKLRQDKNDSTVVEHQLTFDGVYQFSYGGNNYNGDDASKSKERSSANGQWSPDSKHFAITRADMREIKDLWVINSIAQPRPTLETYKYQMPGEPSPDETLYLFDMTTYQASQIDMSAFKDQSISIMSTPRKNSDSFNKINHRIWLGDAGKFYVRRTSRDFKRVDLCRVNVSDGSVEAVIEERLNTYVDSQPIKLFNNGTEILQWSERNGWANIYLYGSDGTLKNNVNNDAYHVSSIYNVDEKARTVLFSATGVDKNENPYYTHIYKISLSGGAPKRLDEPNNSSSSVSFSDDGKYFVNNYSRVDNIPKSTLYDANGLKIMDLEEADFSLLFAAGYKFPEQFKVKAADGITDLWGVMYKPFDFDSTAKYPILDYVYPGPQVEGNNITWSCEKFWRLDRLAQIGFIVVTVGNRGGHPDRSKWYHNYGYGNLRDYGLEDQKYAVQQLASRHNFIDIDRVGIHGHSGGGFMSTAAILKYPDFFKVAVSGAGNHDNSIYNRAWSERHHGIIEEILAEGDTTFKYSIDNNQSMASNLKGHLMLICSDMDNNVHPGNTIRVVNALIRANKRFDMLYVPGQRHAFGDMQEYVFWRAVDYYSEFLLGSSQRDKVDIVQMNND